MNPLQLTYPTLMKRQMARREVINAMSRAQGNVESAELKQAYYDAITVLLKYWTPR